MMGRVDIIREQSELMRVRDQRHSYIEEHPGVYNRNA
jgi:hypothetical protein